jgi:hypothetical protein
VITLSVTYGVHMVDRRNEHRLLELQTRQDSAVIAASILSITDPLTTALDLALASAGNATTFDRYAQGITGPTKPFASASLLQTGSSARLIASVGAAPWLDFSEPAGQKFISSAGSSSTFVVMTLHRSGSERIAYAISSPADPRYVVYAERDIPPDRQVPIEQNSAFADLNYATYVGPAVPENLATTDVPPSHLPLSGYTAHAVIPFGNSEITLTATARGRLGGSLGADLPWDLLASGLLLTAGAVLLVDQLVRRRRRAEHHAETITTLFGELDELYGQQRTVAEALQQALLPPYHPSIRGLEVGSTYVAGVDGGRYRR